MGSAYKQLNEKLVERVNVLLDDIENFKNKLEFAKRSIDASACPICMFGDGSVCAMHKLIERQQIALSVAVVDSNSDQLNNEIKQLRDEKVALETIIASKTLTLESQVAFIVKLARRLRLNPPENVLSERFLSMVDDAVRKKL
jgi:hypothetical protein